MNADLKLQLAEKLCDQRLFNPKGVWGTPGRLAFYLDYLFQGIDLEGKRVLDIGAGVGQFSLYMALSGAKSVTSLEPELEGGSATMVEKFNHLIQEFNLSNVSVNKAIFQEFDPKGEEFDLILCHNSINHLNEECSTDLHENPASYEVYSGLFKQFKSMSSDHSGLLLTDCARSNFFGDIGLRSPFCPTIGFNVHQNPRLWARLASEAGYKAPQISWSPITHLGKLGQVLFSNKLAAYMTMSHFKLFAEL